MRFIAQLLVLVPVFLAVGPFVFPMAPDAPGHALKAALTAGYGQCPPLVWGLVALGLGFFYWPLAHAGRLADALAGGLVFAAVGVLLSVAPDGPRARMAGDAVELFGRTLSTYPWLTAVPAAALGRVLSGAIPWADWE